MRPKILNFGIAAGHDTIHGLGGLLDPTSISDFDAFVFDPHTFATSIEQLCRRTGPATFHAEAKGQGHDIRKAIMRKRNEINSLLGRKGGVVICLLRPNDLKFTASGESQSLEFNKYAFVEDLLTSPNKTLPLTKIVGGSGTIIHTSQNAEGAALQYLRILKGHLQFQAHFALSASYLNQLGKVLAVDSVGNPVAAEFRVGTGVVSFLPIPIDVPVDRVGSAIIQTIRAFFVGPVGIEEPDWAVSLQVPGADVHNEEISRLHN